MNSTKSLDGLFDEMLLNKAKKNITNSKIAKDLELNIATVTKIVLKREGTIKNFVRIFEYLQESE